MDGEMSIYSKPYSKVIAPKSNYFGGVKTYMKGILFQFYIVLMVIYHKKVNKTKYDKKLQSSVKIGGLRIILWHENLTIRNINL